MVVGAGFQSWKQEEQYEKIERTVSPVCHHNAYLVHTYVVYLSTFFNSNYFKKTVYYVVVVGSIIIILLQQLVNYTSIINSNGNKYFDHE